MRHVRSVNFLLAAAAVSAGLVLCASAAAPGPAAGDTPATRLVETLGLTEAAHPVRETQGWHKPQRIVVRRFRPDTAAWLSPVAPGVELVVVDSSEAATAAIRDADAVVGFCETPMIEAGHRLRCIGAPSIAARGILVTNMQRIAGPPMAEHVIALVFALSRQLPVTLAQQREHRWDEAVGENGGMRSIEGKTLLVYGLGGIGTEVAKRAHGLGMRVTAIRASGHTGPEYVSYVGLPDELDRLAREADVIVNSAPLTAATRGLFNQKFFAEMKPTAYFINVGRGGSVVTADLVAALNAGRIAGAGLDVTDPEPLPPDHPLWSAKNVIITPHVSASSEDGNQARFAIARENLRRYVAGEKMLSVVDPARGY
jgi:phosphoglycerate dehydrogenase-like enzyme